jgi:NH3-dependent NAD+ synthetase
VKKLLGMGVHAGDDASEASALGKLPKAHVQELMPARKAAHSVIAAIFVNEPREGLPKD